MEALWKSEIRVSLLVITSRGETMMIRTFAVLTVLSIASAFSARASIDQAPPSFPFRDGVDAVYADFQSADYSIVYDVSKEQATVESEITFDLPKDGYPIFDLVPNPTALKLDGKDANQEEISDPDGATKFRIVKVAASKGRHTLKISHLLTENVSFKKKGVASAFWTSDLDDRQYLEQYLPASFEYDQVAMHLTVEVIGSDAPHAVRANGEVKSAGANRFTVDFPGFYTASCVFFHVAPEGAFPVRDFDYKSVDGRTIPVEIYSSYNLDEFEKAARDALTELESDYGPFPHPKVVVYGTSSFDGGMEYSGATMTSAWALSHEFFHSYNARYVMPANGNAGWMDEAISSWRDHGYDLRKSPGFESTKMAGHSVWTRMTDSHAYDEGAYFLAWIASRMKDRGQDLKAFFKDYFARHGKSTVTTEILRDDLSAFMKTDLKPDFDAYIYGKASSPTGETGSTRGRSSGSTWPKSDAAANPACHLPVARRANPYHPVLTKARLKALLWPAR
jgi:hypothetical protein